MRLLRTLTNYKQVVIKNSAEIFGITHELDRNTDSRRIAWLRIHFALFKGCCIF